MGVLAITQALLEVVFEEQFLVESSSLTHVGGDAHIVLGGVGICFGAELETGLPAGVAFGLNLCENAVVVVRVADHGYVVPVLGCRAKHGRSADVDFLDSFGHGGAFFGDSLSERVEVDANEVDEAYSVLLQCLHMRRFVAASQECAMHFGVEGLDAAVANLGEPGYFTDTNGVDTTLFK